MDKMAEWHEPLAAACKKHGKFFGGFGMSPELLEFYLELGANMLACSSDVGLLSSGSAEISAARRAAVGAKPGSQNSGSSDTGY
jgi:2-keto-3-deoxy-L-rhamnonate aldolase RhmA